MSTLFERLRGAAAPEWAAYVAHPFVAAVGDGSLPPDRFRRYLVQDTLFLFQFCRAAALAAFKSDTLDELRRASGTLHALLEVELPLHLRFCAGWGLDAAAMAATPEAMETIAYTRFVHERGLGGDRLDLEVALAPCVIGYGEIGRALAPCLVARPDHPFREWIETYAGDAYQAMARDAVASLDAFGAARGADARFPALLATFRAATRLEAAFWDMGLRDGA